MSSLFLTCCVTVSLTNAFSFPLSSDCESTDVFLTIQSFSSPLKTFEGFSRRKRALTFAASLSDVLGYFSQLFINLGFHPDCVTSQTQFSPRRPKPCLCRWIVSSCCTVACIVMGEWNYIKHTTDHVDTNLQMNLKESH